jgi:hypothetical protein
MRRRKFIAALGGAAAWSVAVHAQQAKPMPRVAVLMSVAEDDFQVQSSGNALKQGLAVRLDPRHERPNRCSVERRGQQDAEICEGVRRSSP